MTVSVSLRITSSALSAEQIVSSVGMTAAKAWSKGESRKTPKGQPLEGLREYSYATFPLFQKQRLLLSDVLKQCETQLADRATILKTIRDSGGTTELFVGWFLEQSGGDTLSSNLMMALADLGLALSLDVYPAD
jgi:hypothetical protein